jgi:hypothetical protein
LTKYESSLCAVIYGPFWYDEKKKEENKIAEIDE